MPAHNRDTMWFGFRAGSGGLGRQTSLRFEAEREATAATEVTRHQLGLLQRDRALQQKLLPRLRRRSTVVVPHHRRLRFPFPRPFPASEPSFEVWLAALGVLSLYSGLESAPFARATDAWPLLSPRPCALSFWCRRGRDACALRYR